MYITLPVTPRHLEPQPSKLVLGDCINVLKEQPSASIDLTVTDPPYLVDYKSRDGRSILGDVSGSWLKPAFSEIYRVMKPDSLCISFYGWHKIDEFMDAWKTAGVHPVGHIVWRKPYSSSSRFLAYNHEQAYLLAKGRPSIPNNPMPDVQVWKYSGNKLHPTEKSPDILEPLIKSFSKKGAIVLDPFSGSASTAIAARNTERSFFAIEKDQTYYEIAKKRLKLH